MSSVFNRSQFTTPMFALAFTHTGLKIQSQPKAGKILYKSFVCETDKP